MELASQSLDSMSISNQAPIDVAGDDVAAGAEDAVNRFFESVSSTRSPPSKMRRKKTPFSELRKRSLREAVNDMKLVEAFTELAKSLLHNGNR
jgi:hypothetical protein